jgi:hypothetical protein
VAFKPALRIYGLGFDPLRPIGLLIGTSERVLPEFARVRDVGVYGVIGGNVAVSFKSTAGPTLGAERTPTQVITGAGCGSGISSAGYVALQISTAKSLRH